jgi:hypothetical protein
MMMVGDKRPFLISLEAEGASEHLSLARLSSIFLFGVQSMIRRSWRGTSEVVGLVDMGGATG